MKEQSPEQKWMDLSLIREVGLRGDDCIGAAEFVRGKDEKVSF